MGDGVSIKPQNTAIARKSLSRPALAMRADGLLGEGRTLLDYGCGRGSDAALLAGEGHKVAAWDKYHAPDAAKPKSDIVSLTYVLNVIPDPTERRAALDEAAKLANKALVVSVRIAGHDSSVKHAEPFGDGVLTGKPGAKTRTFQKFYTRDEIEMLLQEATGLTPHAAQTGIYYLFKDKALEAAVLGGRDRPAEAPRDIAGERNRAGETLLAEGAAALLATGKVPSRQSTLGRAVFRQQLFGDQPAFAEAVRQIVADADNPEAIRAAASRSPVGKSLPEHLYVHVSAADQLPALLQLKVQAARAIAPEAPASLLKIARDGSSVSFLDYPDFDKAAHPALAGAVTVRLTDGSFKVTDYSGHDSRPILHRKESFVAPDYPGRKRFAALTRAEEAAGLLSRRDIGTEAAWAKVLAEKGVTISGHRLDNAKPRRATAARHSTARGRTAPA